MPADVMIPLCVMGGGLAFAVFVVHRQLQLRALDRELLHRERIAAIKAGGAPDSAPEGVIGPPARPRVANALRDGIGFLIMGAGLAAALRIWGSYAWGWGIFVASIGVANLVYWLIGGRADWEQQARWDAEMQQAHICLLYTSPSPRDGLLSRMPSSA